MKQSIFRHSKKNIFDAVIQTAINLDLVVNKKSLADGHVALEHSGNFLSYGNKINVKIKSTDYDKHIVRVSSSSSAPIQIIDWGTNDRLESEIIETVKAVLNQ